MKLTTCDRSTHRVLSAAILLELKALGDKYGVDFSVDGGRFGDTTGMMRLEHKLQDMAGKQDPDKGLVGSLLRALRPRTGRLWPHLYQQPHALSDHRDRAQPAQGSDLGGAGDRQPAAQVRRLGGAGSHA